MNIEVRLVLCLVVEFASPQFTPNRRVSTPCKNHGSALVEQFFNVIFAEFQHSPPTCTCVQMCADQPTYCYPTGCYRKAERRKETSPVSSIQQDTKTMFLVDNDNAIADLMGNLNGITSSATGNIEKTYQKPWDPNLMNHANPYKEIVFKYKRLPKLQMKYNLREQIKHARDKKAEVDLSKTRWPTNKQINRQFNHQRASNYLTSAFTESNQQETPKYFKRYLTKRENQIGLDISALYLYKDASNFSLETLIDNLIERGLEGANGTSRTSNLSKIKDNDINYDTKLMNGAVPDLQNETKEVVTISLVTNGDNNEDRNTNLNHTTSSTAAYFEMITTLSKQIEKQNNRSMEAIGNLTGRKFNDMFSVKSANISNTSICFDKLKISPKETEDIKSTTDIITTSLHSIPNINSQVKKSKQRIVRKLRNRKLN